MRWLRLVSKTYKLSYSDERHLLNVSKCQGLMEQNNAGKISWKSIDS